MQPAKIPAVSRVMTTFPYAVEFDAPVSEARAIMREHSVRHLPVLRDGQLAGVVSDRDIGLAVGPDPIPSKQDLWVHAIMIPDAYAVDLHTPLDQVLLEMADQHIGCALITRKHKLVGIFTATDACRYFGQYLQGEDPTGNDGEDAA